MKRLKDFRMNLSTRIIDHLIQAFLIFASVFLAFWLTENRESKKMESYLETSLSQIADELEFNHRQVERIFAYYSLLIHEIDSLGELPGINLEDHYGYELPHWRGIQTPMLRATAYQTFLNSGINEAAELGLVKSLADIYNVQSVIEKLNNSFFEIATNDSGFTALSKVRHLTGIYVEILPEILTGYQYNAKPWLKVYGYDLEISNERLRQIIENRYGIN